MWYFAYALASRISAMQLKISAQTKKIASGANGESDSDPINAETTVITIHTIAAVSIGVGLYCIFIVC